MTPRLALMKNKTDSEAQSRILNDKRKTENKKEID
jgi:hypothetical protein